MTTYAQAQAARCLAEIEKLKALKAAEPDPEYRDTLAREIEAWHTEYRWFALGHTGKYFSARGDGPVEEPNL